MYVRSPLDSNGRPNRAKLASGHELLVIRLLASTCKKSQLPAAHGQGMDESKYVLMFGEDRQSLG